MKPVIIVGIDPSSTKLAAVITKEGDPQIDMRVAKLYAGKDKPRACTDAYLFMTEIIDDYPKADLRVFFEGPVFVRGRGATQSIKVHSFIDGAIMTACGLRGVMVTEANNMTWKKDIILNGRATKNDIAAGILASWPAAYKQAEGDQDLLDACGINRYGAQVYQRTARLLKRKTTVNTLRRES